MFAFSFALLEWFEWCKRLKTGEAHGLSSIEIGDVGGFSPTEFRGLAERLLGWKLEVGDLGGLLDGELDDPESAIAKLEQKQRSLDEQTKNSWALEWADYRTRQTYFRVRWLVRRQPLDLVGVGGLNGVELANISNLPSLFKIVATSSSSSKQNRENTVYLVDDFKENCC